MGRRTGRNATQTDGTKKDRPGTLPERTGRRPPKDGREDRMRPRAAGWGYPSYREDPVIHKKLKKFFHCGVTPEARYATTSIVSLPGILFFETVLFHLFVFAVCHFRWIEPAKCRLSFPASSPHGTAGEYLTPCGSYTQNSKVANARPTYGRPFLCC